MLRRRVGPQRSMRSPLLRVRVLGQAPIRPVHACKQVAQCQVSIEHAINMNAVALSAYLRMCRRASLWYTKVKSAGDAKCSADGRCSPGQTQGRRHTHQLVSRASRALLLSRSSDIKMHSRMRLTAAWHAPQLAASAQAGHHKVRGLHGNNLWSVAKVFHVQAVGGVPQATLCKNVETAESMSVLSTIWWQVPIHTGFQIVSA